MTDGSALGRAAALVVALALAVPAAAREEPVTYLRAAHLVDPEAGDLGATVLTVRGERIESVGDAVPEGAQVVDLGDATLILGLIDVHTHLTYAAGEPFPAGNVITVTGGPCSQTLADIRVFDGTPEQGIADTPAEIVEAVRYQIRYGVRVIEVCLDGTFDVDETKLLVDTAHRLDVPVAAHVDDTDDARIAIEAGVDSIEHITLLDDGMLDAIAAGKRADLVALGADPRVDIDAYRDVRFVMVGGRVQVGAGATAER